jgi:Flp pilus assembly protein TadG
MIRRLRSEQRGASTVVVALCMTAVLIVVALVVDIGATAARKAQLQDAADAAALAIAELCFEDEDTTTREGCAVDWEDATAVANQIADDTVFGGVEQARTALSFPTDTAAPFARESVVVTLSSVQAALFSFDRDDTDVLASATAEWRQTVALPLGVNSCVVPDPGGGSPEFVGTGLYTGVNDLLRGIVGNLDDENLVGYLDNLLSCGVSLLAGGWMQSLVRDDCSYDPALLVSTLSSTVERLLPVNQVVPDMCSATIENLIGKRIVVPTFEHATGATVQQLLGISGTVAFTEIVVTGYDFDGILGIGDRNTIAAGTPGCATSLYDLLGITDGGLETLIRNLGRAGILGLLRLPIVGPVADSLGLSSLLTSLLDGLADLVGILLPGVLDGLLNRAVDLLLDVLFSILDLCQGVQGYVVATGMNAAQAAERINTPVRLVA